MPRRSPSTDMPYRVSVCGKDEIDRYASLKVTHILSLEDPDTPKTTPAWFQGLHWQLHFHDVESAYEAHLLNGTPVTSDQVAAILRCGEACLRESRSRPVHLLVHCMAGISRSTAASYLLVAQALGPGRALEALQYVLRRRPEAFPNRLLVKLGDCLLGRQGELIRALTPPRVP